MPFVQSSRSILAFGVLALAHAATAVDYRFEVYKTPLRGYDNTWLYGLSDDGIAHGFAINQADAASTYFIDRRGRGERVVFGPQFTPSDIAMGGVLFGTIITTGDNPTSIPAVRKKNGKFDLINVPFGINALGNGINNSGRVAGTYDDLSGGRHGFLAHGNKTTRYDYRGSAYTVLNDVNDAGWAVGYAYAPDGSTVNFITNGNRTTRFQTGLDSWSSYVPRYINNANTIVGTIISYSTEGYSETAAVYAKGKLKPLVSPKVWPATIELVQSGYPTTYQFVSQQFVVTGLNNRGQITATSIGSYYDPFNPWFEYRFVESYIGYPVCP